MANEAKPNGSKITISRIIAGVTVAVILTMAGTIFANYNRITALEVRMESLSREVNQIQATQETNRVENRSDHAKIEGMLTQVLKEIR